MEASEISVVLPVQRQEDHIERVVESHLAGLTGLGLPCELLLVCNASDDATERICGSLAARHPNVTHLSLRPAGAGRAYRLGLDHARGDLLCITNSARTDTPLLVGMLAAALEHPEPALLKTSRVRNSEAGRRLGSWLFNAECRALLGLRAEDVNGTPKIFPRTFTDLLDLREDRDAIDAEMLAICRRQGHPVVERRIPFPPRHSGRSTTNLASAIRLVASVPRLRSRLA